MTDPATPPASLLPHLPAPGRPGPSRRRLLAGGAALGGAALLGGCSEPPRLRGLHAPRPLSRKPWVGPRISRDRVVRVIVGHRPYRPEGFVVRRDELDRKTVIHNYGHGGGGITLAWGSSALALRQAAGLRPGPVTVLGGGIMGLTTARLLQDEGWEVTIRTRSMPRHSTSNVGGGQWAPTSVFDEERVDEGFLAQFAWASRISHHAYQNLVGAGYGVRFVENYVLGHESPETPWYLEHLPELFPLLADLEPGEHPFPVPHVRRFVTLLVQPAQFLRRVRADFLRAGGRIEIRDFRSLSEVLALPDPVVFNCTGLGARALFGDESLVPAKGQLVLLPPDPAVDYLTVGGGTDVTYMFSRDGEILLGGSFEKGNWSREPDPRVTERILTDNAALFADFDGMS